jgi:hypothetical protein
MDVGIKGLKKKKKNLLAHIYFLFLFIYRSVNRVFEIIVNNTPRTICK